MNTLDGRRALVTGAGSGLGREIARALKRAGADLVLVGRSRDKLEEVALELGESQVITGDVSDADDVARMAEEAGFVDILVNNAGIGGPVANIVDIEPADWDEVFAINVRGVYLMCRAFLPAMIERGDGDVINLASVTGKRPLAGRTPYAASKMAVIGLTATLAFETGTTGVRVNSLSPGPVNGDRMQRMFAGEAERSGITAEEAETNYASRAAMKRLLEEHEVGTAVVAMLQFSGMTGADIDLSTGMIARS